MTTLTRTNTVLAAAAAVAAAALAIGCDGRHQIGDDTGGGGAGTGDAPGAVTAVAVDTFHTCAAVEGGRTFCWGMKASPGFLDPSSELDTRPVEQAWLAGTVQIAAGYGLTEACALRADHTVLCWGSNSDGELGRGDVTPAFEPPSVVPGVAALQIAAGARHRCALLVDGTVACWGDNGNGACGQPPDVTPIVTPTPVPGLADVVELDAKEGHTCARRGNGDVWCWGFNLYGETGAPGGTQVAGPARVDLPAPATHVGCNPTMSCASVRGGEVWCWGIWNPATATLMPAPPTHLLTGGDVRQLVGASDRLCVVRAATFDFVSGGGCAENTNAEPGAGVTGLKLAQVRGSVWTKMAVAEETACAVDDGGRLWCWGDNTYGQAGTGMSGDLWPQPVAVRW